MATIREHIGTAQTRTTPQAWEDSSVPADVVTAANIYIGELLAEEFAVYTYFNGHTTSADYYYELTADEGAEHDGRAHEVSGEGNARIVYTGNNNIVLISDEFVRVSWLEIYGPGNNARAPLYAASVAACTIYLHHNILHNNGASQGENFGMWWAEGAAEYVAACYRNIVYGMGGVGIFMQSQVAAASVIYNNTVYANNASGSAALGGIYTGEAAGPVENNASMSQLTNKDFYNQTGVLDYNCDSDGSETEGAHSITGVTANQFVAPTTTWAQADLRLKAGADCINAGHDLTALVATLPELNVPIHDRSATVGSGAGVWDIGADEYIASAGGFIPYPHPRGLRGGMVPMGGGMQ